MNSTNDRPVYVVSGLPRSGTSLMMQMITAGGIAPLTDGERAADDDNPRGYYELEAVKRTKADAAWLSDAPGKVVKVIHLLLKDLPNTHDYRIVMMRRHMDEVLASQAKMLERLGRAGGKLSAQQLAGVYQKQLAEVKQLVASSPNMSMIDVDYNDLVADPKSAVDALAAFIDADLDVDAMLGAVDPSLYRNRS